MNEAQLEFEADLTLPYQKKVVVDSLEEVVHQHVVPPLKAELPPELKRLHDFVLENHNYSLSLTIAENTQPTKPILVDFLLDEHDPVLLDYIHIKAQTGSNATVVLRYQSTDATECFHGGFVTVEAQTGAQINLVILQMLGDKTTHLHGSSINVNPKAQGNCLHCELGGSQVISGSTISLLGTESRGDVNTLYVGNENRKQDFNYRLQLTGAASEGNIVCRGALLGNAKKTLKSTLDFVRGAFGAKGREEETTLVLSDRAINLSTPLLLCGEENVEGEHATFCGNLDADKLYYVMSRGYTLQEAKTQLVMASFVPIITKLPTAELQAAVQQKIQQVIYGKN